MGSHAHSLASLQARSEEESLGLQTQLETAGAEVEQAHARLAALELEKERKASQVGYCGGDSALVLKSLMLVHHPTFTWHCYTGMTLHVKLQRGVCMPK